MVRSIKIIKGLLLVFFMLQPVYSPAAVGYLTVRIEPGTLTMLDSQLVANQSFENLALGAGTYLLHVYDPRDYNWQDRGFSEQITIQEAETLYFDLQPKNKLRVISNPANGLVYIDSLFIGKTPLLLLNSDLDGKQITVSKAGYQNFSFIKTAAENNYSLLLKPSGPSPAPLVVQNQNTNKLNWLDEGLIITSLAGSWLSFLFKRTADTSYDKYLHSARPNDIKKYYDRSVRYDRYAEISFTVSVLSLGSYFYLLLSK